MSAAADWRQRLNLPHVLVAAVLNYEWIIGTRNGCFCARPYVKSLMAVSESDARDMESRILNRDRSMLLGTIRVSFGLYNTMEDVDTLCTAVEAIARGEFQKDYVLNAERGQYYRPDMGERYCEFFDL